MARTTRHCDQVVCTELGIWYSIYLISEIINASDRDVSAFCITVGGGNVYAKGHFQVAWDWVSHQGKKEKEISKAENTSVREKTREVVPPPQTDIFPIWPQASSKLP